MLKGGLMHQSKQSNRSSSSEMVLAHLREQIINGQLAPRERLLESDIAKRLGVSRGPVRDALKRLAIEGLVDYKPNRGCSVARLSPKDAYEVFFLRGNLEKLAIQKSNCRINDYGLLTMETTLEELKTATEDEDLMRAVKADELFHQQIIRSAQIDRLTKMWELLSPLNSAMFLSVQDANRFGIQINDRETLAKSSALESHTELYKAIKRNDQEAACRLLDIHYEATGERVYRLSLLREKAGIA